MVAQTQASNTSISNTIPTHHINKKETVLCALCQLPAHRHINSTINNTSLTFCCYGCRHIYQVIAPEVANGVAVPVAIGQAGFDLSAPCCRGIIHGDPTEEASNTLSRLMLNAFLAMMVMVLSLALYSDFFFESWGQSGQGVRSMLQLMAMLFATPAVLLLALPILEDAIFTFQVRQQLTTSALIAVGSLAAYGLSVYAVFIGQGHTYFETATMTLLLVTLGRWLDAKTQIESTKALDQLLARAPAQVSLITHKNNECLTPVENLKVGDLIRVRPGENFAVDGKVLEGEGSVNEANITGEATAVYKGPTHTVYAGTNNIDGSFIIKATHVGEGRVMGKLIRLLDEARLYRAPIERLADRIAAYFVPTVIVLALITFIFWTWQVSFEQGLLTALAVLLIACPCALGIATPLAIWAALGRAAQQGILIKDSLSLEKLSRIKHIFFDKTGTLTTGQPNLAKIVTNHQSSPKGETFKTSPLSRGIEEETGQLQLLQLAASIEHHSEHPLAHAIVVAAKEQGLELLPIEKFQAIPGQGVQAVLQGQSIYLGSWRLLKQQQLNLSANLDAKRQQLEQDKLTVIYIGWDGQVQGLFGLAETIRPTAPPLLSYLKNAGLTINVLTGDSATAGTALSERLGVNVQSQLLPHNKLELIEQAESKAPVAMVGDGLNDAPALARASIGIALGCGADVTREAADISLLGTDLTQIAWVRSLAQRTYRTIAWNLTWAFIYNVLGIALAITGFLHPVLAAAAMVISSAMVIINSLRIFNH